eukprot:6273825-Alexandrium_andersonii.AAC.1
MVFGRPRRRRISQTVCSQPRSGCAPAARHRAHTCPVHCRLARARTKPRLPSAAACVSALPAPAPRNDVVSRAA